MDYKELVTESILFFENAIKRDNELLKSVTRTSAKLQLEKELEVFSKMKGFWHQEEKRIGMIQKYSKNWNSSM